MKEENNTPYHQLIKQLKSTSPLLPNPQETADAILRQITQMPPKSRKFKILHATSRIAAIAAGLLLCLLIKETTPKPETEPTLSGPVQTLPHPASPPPKEAQKITATLLTTLQHKRKEKQHRERRQITLLQTITIKNNQYEND